MTIFLAIIGTLLLLSVLILLLPLSYNFRFTLSEEIEYRVLGGSALLAFVTERKDSITTIRLRFLGVPFRTGGGKTKKTRKKEKPAEKKKKSSQMPRSKKETIKHFCRFVMDLLAMLKPRVFQFDARVGFIEPDYNGLALAFYYSLKSIYPQFPLRWETVWEAETAEATGEIAGRVLPAAVLWRVLVFILSRPTLRLFREIRRQKKSVPAAT